MSRDEAWLEAALESGVEIYEPDSLENYVNNMTKKLEFTEAEIKELRAARKKPIIFDEDCPEVTPEKAMKFYRVNPSRNMKRK